jgi:hypothetical protein
MYLQVSKNKEKKPFFRLVSSKTDEKSNIRSGSVIHCTDLWIRIRNIAYEQKIVIFFSVPEFRLKARFFGLHLRVLGLVKVRLLLPFLALLLRLLLLVKNRGQSEKSRSYLSPLSPPPCLLHWSN